VADGKLIFSRPADGSGLLVFGDDGGGSQVPATEAGIDADFKDDMSAGVQLVWDANVSRERMVFCRQHWQDAKPRTSRAMGAWQDSRTASVRIAGHWQDAIQGAARTSSRWQDTERINALASAAWQDATGRKGLTASSWQDERSIRAAVGSAWQDSKRASGRVSAGWQEQLRTRALASQSWQDAQRINARALHSAGPAVPVHRVIAAVWQDARRPLAGVSRFVPPEPPVPEPCYDPATLGTLVFSDPWTPGDARLVFVCNRGGGYPPGTIVVPVRRAYIVQNDIALYRLPSGDEFKASTFTLDIDADSWTFSWSASLHSSALPHLARSVPGERVEVQCIVNSVPLRLVVESISRDRSFPENRIAVRGRGRAAFLEDSVASFGNTAPRSAAQLMADVLTVNGASIGWSLDWQITDWTVPGNIWNFYGSRIDALKDIAGAVGAYIQPHPTDPVLRVLHRYPVAPWDWESDLTPNIVLPVESTSVEGIEEVIRPDFNQVHVGGLKAPAVFGPVVRGGTPGDKEAEQVLHSLITAAPAHVQRGRAVLSDTGVQEHVTLRTMVLPETGIILPGTVVSYVSSDRTRLGIVRKTGLQMQTWPVLHQTLGVETHVFE
jgi:hypothetical protein